MGRDLRKCFAADMAVSGDPIQKFAANHASRAKNKNMHRPFTPLQTTLWRTRVEIKGEKKL
jgi:hypothetical protein